MFQRFFKIRFHRGKIPLSTVFRTFFTSDHDMIRAAYTILRQQLRKQSAKPALHAVARNSITDFLGDSDAITDSVGGDGMARAAFMGEQDEIRRHESLAPIRSQKIRPFANHFNRDKRFSRNRLRIFCAGPLMCIFSHHSPFGQSRVSGSLC